MPTLNTSSLWRLEEAPELLTDGYVLDGDRAIFVSLWGRDTAIQELLAKMTLSPGGGGLTHVTLQCTPSITLRFDQDRLVKRSTRTYRQTSFGNMLNVWLFDQRCEWPDRARRQCYALFDERAANLDTSALLWSRLRDLAAFPLLDDWQPVVVKLLKQQGAIRPLDQASEHLSGVWIDLSLTDIQDAISQLILTGKLAIQ